MMTKPRILKLTVESDGDTENPLEHDGWSLYSFSRRHGDLFRDPADFDPTENDHVRQKLESGMAYWLDCYQHGGITWSLSGEGTQCRWDTARRGGLLIWEQAGGGPPDWATDTRVTLGVFNAWANGECYHYAIEDYPDGGGPTDRACGGFIGGAASDIDGLTPGVLGYDKATLTRPGTVVVLAGDCDFAIDESKMKAAGVRIVTADEADDMIAEYEDTYCHDELVAWEAMC